MRFKIDWSSLIVVSKFPFFALFYFVFEGNFLSTSPPGGAYIWRGDLTEGFCVKSIWGSYLEGLIFGILRYLKNQMEIVFISNYVYSNEAITKTPTI